MSQYLLSVYVSDEELAGVSEEDMAQTYADVDEFNQKLQAQRAWVFAGGLHPASTATVVNGATGDVVVTDGPFAEAKEYLGGFWIIEAADLDVALQWASEATVACRGPVEVRPFEDVPEA